MSDLARSFPPIANTSARVLILGSMPGVASLGAQQYYAHPRNAFWPIMGELFGAGPELPYEARCERLMAAGVAVWDVLQECRRAGSLDANIERGTEVANNFAALFAACPRLDRVLFNGQKAEATFRRRVLDDLAVDRAQTLTLCLLPSTSPAHAGVRFQHKLSAWRDQLQKRTTKTPRRQGAKWFKRIE